MGAILVSVPDISDDDLVFDENESRQILKFLWPAKSQSIVELTVDNDLRRLAQTALIAAIDGSYALGFTEATFRATARPGGNLKSLARKLAKKFVKLWWKHTRQSDLNDVKVYECVRTTIAANLGHRLTLIEQGVSLQRGGATFYAVPGSSHVVWA